MASSDFGGMGRLSRVGSPGHPRDIQFVIKKEH